MSELTGKTMKALWYNAVRGLRRGETYVLIVPQPEDFDIRQVPIPEVGDDDVLLKGVLAIFLFVIFQKG